MKWNINSYYCLLRSDAIFCGKGLPVFRCKLPSHQPTFFSARKWKQQGPPNRRNILYQITRLHIPPGFTFIVTAVRNRNPRKSVHFNNNFSLNSYLHRPLSAIFFSQKRPVRLWGSPFIVFIGCKGTLSGLNL